MIKGVAALSVGQVLNQLLTMGGYIYLARVYQVEDFGGLAIVLAVGSLIGGVSTLQYELTVLLPRSERVAKLAQVATVVTALCVHLIYLLLLLVFSALSAITVLEAVAIFFVSLATATVSLTSSVLNRAEKYVRLASINLVRTVLTLIFAVLFPVLISRENGLVFAHASASLLLSFALLFLCVRVHEVAFLMRNPRRYFYWLKRNQNFALFTTPAACFSYLSSSMPVFLLRYFFGEWEVGLYSMLQRIIMGPLAVVTGAVNRVFHRELTRRLYSGETVKTFYESLSLKLVLLGLLGVGVIFIVSHYGFMGIVFGEQWKDLDSLLLLFSPAAFGAFVAASLSGFAVIGRNKIGMQFQLLNLIVVVCSISIGYVFFGDFTLVMLAFSAGLALSYIVHWLAMNYVILQNERHS